ncbi:MAG: hypothetical protein QXK04_06720, partial [Ignisphaera sp.]
IMVMVVKICVVYYSRTGNTAHVVEVLKNAFSNIGADVDVYRVFPVREYSKPLHINPRVIYDTLVRKGTDIDFDPEKPMLERYSVILIASPIWIGRLAPPIQEFLKSYTALVEHLVIITTSAMPTECRKIEKSIEESWRLKPMLCINITTAMIKDSTGFRRLIHDIVKKLVEISKR